MEIVGAIILLVAVWYGGKASEHKNKTYTKSYKWCKCADKPMWGGDE